jgi:hypothetical protein
MPRERKMKSYWITACMRHSTFPFDVCCVIVSYLLSIDPWEITNAKSCLKNMCNSCVSQNHFMPGDHVTVCPVVAVIADATHYIQC